MRFELERSNGACANLLHFPSKIDSRIGLVTRPVESTGVVCTKLENLSCHGNMRMGTVQITGALFLIKIVRRPANVKDKQVKRRRERSYLCGTPIS